MQAIIIAIISGLCVAVPSILTTLSANKRNYDLMRYQIAELTEKVNKHNNLIDRMYRIEARVTLLEEEHKKEG